MARMHFLFALLLIIPLGVGLAVSEDDPNAPNRPAEENELDTKQDAEAKSGEKAKPKPGPFDKAILEAAASYKPWGEADKAAHWAPTMCAMPPAPRARRSQATSKGDHARKLYFLYAKDAKAYRALRDQDQPVGQVLVKQAHTPVAVKSLPPYSKRTRGLLLPLPKAEGASDEDAEKTKETKGEATSTERHFVGLDPYVQEGEKVYRAGDLTALFLMLKMDPKTPGTDAGWVYATVDPATKKVTAAGRIASCVRCHADAARDRMFGLPVVRRVR